MPGLMIDAWKQRARQVKGLVFALYLAYRDPRTPWYARLVAIGVVAYAFSPLDLIPDPIPVLGYLDDLVLIPLGVALAVKLIPPEVWSEAQVQAASAMGKRGPTSWIAAGVIVLLWLVLALAAIMVVRRLL
jgi:uncharacterized membrane protein YkvA (DUF1232 family)